jgi:hypothetical protein
MSIMPFLVAVVFFLVINLFLALVLSSLAVIGLKLTKIQIERRETSWLIFICCLSIWIAVRVILLNLYSFQRFIDVFLWPMSRLLPEGVLNFLSSSTGL